MILSPTTFLPHRGGLNGSLPEESGTTRAKKNAPPKRRGEKA